MRILLSWLRDYIEWTGSVEEIATTLVRSGIEVEAIEHVGLTSNGIVAAQVLEVGPHPNADRLRVCTISDGHTEYRVVCGAPNVEAGLLVAFALPGTSLPNGTAITVRTIRGVESHGMICSAFELGVGDDHDGILVLDRTTKPGTDLQALFPPDVVLEISITPNRADALSHFGIARILAARTHQQAHLPRVEVVEQTSAPCTIEIADPDLCWRYAARVLENVTIRPSPQWLRARLERAGLRPRNVVVDVTNYVMLECGHPLHAFDFDMVENGHIVVRCARNDETHIVTLDGVTRQLDTSMLCICDATKPLAIAGVMGGANSAITDKTQRVLLESAYFHPPSIRRTAKTLGLQTDASYRFERGADIEMVRYALDRASALIAELTGARMSEPIDVYPRQWVPPVLTLRMERAERILGTQLDSQTVAESLRQAGYKVHEHTTNHLSVQVPSYRRDVSAEIDVIEDVAIAIGYDAIEPSQAAVVPFAARNIPVHLQPSPHRDRLRDVLSCLGFHETLSYHLQAPETVLDESVTVEVANALGRERSVLRQWLFPSMLENLSRNARYGAESIRLFEVGKTFRLCSGTEGSVCEEERLAVAIAGQAAERHWLAKERPADLFDLKGVVEALMDQFGVEIQWEVAERKMLHRWFSDPVLSLVTAGGRIGYLGHVHQSIANAYDLPPTTFVAEFSLEPLYRSNGRAWQYIPPSSYPDVVRDIAIVVEHSVPSATIGRLIAEVGGELLRTVEPFDVFIHPSIGEGNKSIAFRLTFGSKERTLTDEEVNAVLTRIVDALKRQFNAQLRTT
ncbi:MAG: phenylalanine--tRNA ligase beta subunit [Candidatus Kapaibacterium sp.]|nr:MAG: phenylalanine--tRNA ligase beta subunit [Candidatus Kapabacteria bacterium]